MLPLPLDILLPPSYNPPNFIPQIADEDEYVSKRFSESRAVGRAQAAETNAVRARQKRRNRMDLRV